MAKWAMIEDGFVTMKPMEKPKEEPASTAAYRSIIEYLSVEVEISLENGSYEAAMDFAAMIKQAELQLAN